MNAYGDRSKSLPRRLQNAHDLAFTGAIDRERSTRRSGASTDPSPLSVVNGFNTLAGEPGADFTFGDHKRTALAQVAGVYHVGGLKLQTGPGFEVVETEKSSGATSNKAYFVWAVGAGYDFHVGPLSLTPTAVLDFVGETKTNLTYLLAVGMGF